MDADPLGRSPTPGIAKIPSTKSNLFSNLEKGILPLLNFYPIPLEWISLSLDFVLDTVLQPPIICNILNILSNLSTMDLKTPHTEELLKIRRGKR
jgi:hypothetical protein